MWKSPTSLASSGVLRSAAPMPPLMENGFGQPMFTSIAATSDELNSLIGSQSILLRILLPVLGQLRTYNFRQTSAARSAELVPLSDGWLIRHSSNLLFVEHTSELLPSPLATLPLLPARNRRYPGHLNNLSKESNETGTDLPFTNLLLASSFWSTISSVYTRSAP